MKTEEEWSLISVRLATVSGDTTITAPHAPPFLFEVVAAPRAFIHIIEFECGYYEEESVGMRKRRMSSTGTICLICNILELHTPPNSNIPSPCPNIPRLNRPVEPPRAWKATTYKSNETIFLGVNMGFASRDLWTRPCLESVLYQECLVRYAYTKSLTIRKRLVLYRSEYDTLGTSIKAALVYLGTALVKLVCLATFLKVSENDSFDPYQELLKALIGFIDVAGLYFALTQLTHRNISQNHKFQAVGLGWAFADSVLHRLAPLWVGARGLEFTWDYILQGLEANANLVLSISLAALGSLMWLRKNKPKTLIPIIYACAGIVATMPSITSAQLSSMGTVKASVTGTWSGWSIRDIAAYAI
ncbi:hypothetical protein GH714_005576 [Hevea brasiliensis]|uniref:BOS complex subunit TMEM147 n=1 Tax=Hevea brasiliensis TaxID=3981 RepID=A0A6A6M851_HEVBR|nr:hypothetical protein GH714_005576 [Hevea brasiliensis]